MVFGGGVESWQRCLSLKLYGRELFDRVKITPDYVYLKPVMKLKCGELRVYSRKRYYSLLHAAFMRKPHFVADVFTQTLFY